MKYLIILVLSVTLIQENNNDIMLNMTNIYREHYGKKALDWSDDIYKVSKSQLINTIENDTKYDSLYHINDTLDKYDLDEIILSKYFNKKRHNKGTINPFVDMGFYNFCKTHFTSIYKENLVKIKIIRKLSENRYIVKKIKNDIYVYNNKLRRGIILVDSTIDDLTYIRTRGVYLEQNKKIKVSPYNTSSVKNELFIIGLLQQWDQSPLHKKILLSDDIEYMAGDVMINNDMLYSLMNFK